ncbi:hypothetical protein [Rhizobium viscosum]|uniref:Uncharacterized protein n=1 Tax=Rhizobium viscosum TaxID=1673 RepID=A0ABR9ISI0_RHIVS|nr:hypothetical protein [Rhizobium viscosum]MBE1506093.1 hypothetical protein [Rhizobium viscosum]
MRPPDTLNRAPENKRKAWKDTARLREPMPALAITVCTFLETWPALFFFAGFHTPRYAVPFSGIKAKKIPIVQPKLTSRREKNHKKFLLFKINRIKTGNFLIISAW